MKIAVASGKGGTGKTMLSTNLASLIAKKDKVVLADFDVGCTVGSGIAGLVVHCNSRYTAQLYSNTFFLFWRPTSATAMIIGLLLSIRIALSRPCN